MESLDIAFVGLSPLARGNLCGLPLLQHLPGTIPARAGEPHPARLDDFQNRDYPRSRGGTLSVVSCRLLMLGLSPLARGNRQAGDFHEFNPGTIPARAGEPKVTQERAAYQGDYPRSRGGTSPAGARTLSVRGLSPLARGNHWQARGGVDGGGTIPARAGEPSHRWRHLN